MADNPISLLNELTTPANDDQIAINDVSEPGTGETKKIEKDNLFKLFNINLKASTELTISTGKITVTQSVHKIQPETGTVDTLDTINGMAAGDVVVLYVTDEGTDTITIKHGTGNISCLGGEDVAISEGSAIFYSDGTTVYLIGGGKTGDYLCQGRLTLQSGVPISTSDQADKTNLYFTPYNGNKISLYNGASWITHKFTQRTLAVGGFTASKPYDIFIHNNAGTLTLSGVVWTNNTTRAAALTTQDGVYVKTGATGYRYLGTIYIDSGQKCQDTSTKKFVWNYYNRILRSMLVTETTIHTYSGAARLWNNSSTNNLIMLVTGMSWINATANMSVRIRAGADGSSAWTYIYLDGADFMSPYLDSVKNMNDQYIQASASVTGLVGAGYHYFDVREQGDHVSSTFFYMGLNIELEM